MVDSGAARSMATKEALENAGLTLQKLTQPLYMRLADDKIASKPIEEAVQDCSLSALNGDVHTNIPEILAVDKLPDCD
eukprot:COSAG02_NODE_4203_length_5629_cov_3.527667_9_plen_78_part_00